MNQWKPVGIKCEAGRKRRKGGSAFSTWRPLSLLWVVVALPVWQCKSFVRRKKGPPFLPIKVRDKTDSRTNTNSLLLETKDRRSQVSVNCSLSCLQLLQHLVHSFSSTQFTQKQNDQNVTLQMHFNNFTSHLMQPRKAEYLYMFLKFSNRAHSSRTSIKKLFDFNERSSNSLFITDYEGGNVSDHCWDKSAGIKSHMNYDMKIILSFFWVFNTLISALLVLETECECYTIEYLVQLKNFFQLKCTFSEPLEHFNAAVFSIHAMKNIEDCLVLIVLLKISFFPGFQIIHSGLSWCCEHTENEKNDLLESRALQMKCDILFLIWINHMKAIK